MFPSPSVGPPWLSRSPSPAFGPCGIPPDAGLGVVAAGAGAGVGAAGVVVVCGGGGGVVWVGVAGTVACVVVTGAGVVCGLGLVTWWTWCGFAWWTCSWTTGLAATVWVAVVAWVEAVGFEDEPQPAATAAIMTVARRSLSRVIVVKDATFGGLLPVHAWK